MTVGKLINRGITELSIVANAVQKVRLEEAHPAPHWSIRFHSDGARARGSVERLHGRRCVKRRELHG